MNDDTAVKKRKRSKHVSPNEHILEFLYGLKEKAEGSYVFCLSRAIKSVESEQLPITTKEELLKLKYIGGFLANQIAAFIRNNPRPETPSASSAPEHAEAANGSDNPKKRKRPYQPRFRSGPYAILLALRDGLEHGKSHMSKAEIAQKAQKYADEPIIARKTGGPSQRNNYYDGWSSVGRTLVKRNLVVKFSNPAKYALTDGGREVADLCAAVQENAQNNVVDVYDPSQFTGTVGATDTAASTNSNKDSAAAAAADSKKVDGIDDINFGMLGAKVMASMKMQNYTDASLNNAWNRLIASKQRPDTEEKMRIALLGCLNPENVTPNIELNNEDEVIDLVEGGVSGGTRAQRASRDVFMLILDSREKLGIRENQSCGRFAEKFRELNVPTEMRALPVGDAVFVRKCVESNTDHLLDFIAERKTVADFIQSVQSERVLRQAYSMQNSKLSRRSFVVEGQFDANMNEKLLERYKKTLAELVVLHGFFVRRTKNTKETVSFYKSVHRNLGVENELPFEQWCDDMEEFNSCLTVEQLFFFQLRSIHRVGKKAALTIIEMGYKTIRDLKLLFASLDDEEGPSFLRNEAKRRDVGTIPINTSRALYNLFRADTYY